jgi:hypothetical protein
MWILYGAVSLACSLNLAKADLPPAGYDVSVSYYEGNTQTLNNGNFVSAGSSPSATQSGCVLSTAVRTACATSFATVGDLGSTSSMQDTSQSTMPAAYESSNGIEWFRDTVTVTGAGMSPGGTFTLVPTVTVDGKSSWDNVALPNTTGIGMTEWAGDGSTVLEQLFRDTTQSSYSASFTLDPITFQAGTPFSFMLGFGEAAFIDNGPSASENSSVTANFLSTMSVTGLEVLDNNGSPVGQFSVASVLGGVYGPNGVTSVPEPGFVALPVAPLLFGFILYRRRSTRDIGLGPLS